MPDLISSASDAALQSLTPDTSSSATPATADTVVTPTTTPNTGDPAAIGGTQKFTVKDNGVDVEVSLDELLSGHLRHRDYTKKTMDIAEQRKQIEAIQTAASTRETQMNDFMKDAAQVAQYYQYLTGQPITAQQVAAQVDASGGNPALDVANLRKELLSEIEAAKAATQGEMAKFSETQKAARVAEFDSQITATVKGILSDDTFESLRDIGDDAEVSDYLCTAAMKLGPRTMEETKVALLQAANAKLEHITARRASALKQSAAKGAKLTSGIEPPGGTGVTPKPTHFKLGDKSLTDAATALIASMKK